MSDIQVSNDFKNKIVRWVKLDDDLRKFVKQLKKLMMKKTSGRIYFILFK